MEKTDAQLAKMRWELRHIAEDLAVDADRDEILLGMLDRLETELNG